MKKAKGKITITVNNGCVSINILNLSQIEALGLLRLYEQSTSLQILQSNCIIDANV